MDWRQLQRRGMINNRPEESKTMTEAEAEAEAEEDEHEDYNKENGGVSGG